MIFSPNMRNPWRCMAMSRHLSRGMAAIGYALEMKLSDEGRWLHGREMYEQKARRNIKLTHLGHPY